MNYIVVYYTVVSTIAAFDHINLFISMLHLLQMYISMPFCIVYHVNDWKLHVTKQLLICVNEISRWVLYALTWSIHARYSYKLCVFMYTFIRSCSSPITMISYYIFTVCHTWLINNGLNITNSKLVLHMCMNVYMKVRRNMSRSVRDLCVLDVENKSFVGD